MVRLEKIFLREWQMLDKTDRMLLAMLQQDCTLSLQT